MSKVFCTFLQAPLMYSFDNLPQIYNIRPDIVVIELKLPFDITDHIKPACLPTKPIVPGSRCYATGWGLTQPWKIIEEEPVEFYVKLQGVSLKVLSPDDCEKVINDFRSRFKEVPPTEILYSRDYEICAEGGVKSVCKGDSGGPLVCEGKFIIQDNE